MAVTIDDLVLEYQRSKSTEALAAITEAMQPTLTTLVAKQVRRQPRGAPSDELYTAAWEGMRQSLARFRQDRGACFVTFSSKRITGAILDWLRHIDVIKRGVRRRMAAHARAVRALTASLGRAPTDDEVVEAMGTEIVPQDAFGRVPTSLGYDQSSVIDTSAPDPADEAVRRDLREFVCVSLSNVERQVLILSYYENMTLREIGQVVGLSESRVLQVRKTLLNHLRERLADRRELLMER